MTINRPSATWCALVDICQPEQVALGFEGALENPVPISSTFSPNPRGSESLAFSARHEPISAQEPVQYGHPRDFFEPIQSYPLTPSTAGATLEGNQAPTRGKLLTPGAAPNGRLTGVSKVKR